MDHRRTCETLTAIERSMDVNTLTYDGRRIWPIVRWRLFGALGAGQSARTLGPTHYLPDLLGQRLSSLMAATDEADVGQLVVFERVSNLLKASQTKQQLASLGTSHFLFFCRAAQHYETVQGGRYSPVLDSILEACGARSEPQAHGGCPDRVGGGLCAPAGVSRHRAAAVPGYHRQPAGRSSAGPVGGGRGGAWPQRATSGIR